MGNSYYSSSQKITKPQTSTIISVQHKEYESIHDSEELRQLKQLPKPVPLRPSIQSSPNPAANIGTSNLRERRSSLSDHTANQFQENEIDSNHSIRTAPFLRTPSIIGSNYSNSSMQTESNMSASDSTQPFNPNALLPPKLAADGMDAMYKHLREHFTSLAVKADCNQVSVTYKIHDIDEQLAITRANMIDIDYTSNQLQRTISCMKTLDETMAKLTQQCQDAVKCVNNLWQQLPSTPRSLAMFTAHDKQRRIVMQGNMLRVGSYLKGNKQRWVVLYIDGLMAYYNWQRTELKGVIDLMHATEVVPSDLSHLMITVKKENDSNKSTSWHFKCPSPQDVAQWLDAIRSLHFIRAKSKHEYSENVPAQFLRDNTITFMKNRLDPKCKHCVFNVLHFAIDGRLYQMSVYSDGNTIHFMYEECMKQNYNDDNEYIDWNLVKNTFESDNEHKYHSNSHFSLTFMDEDEIVSIKISEKQVMFATKHCIQSVSMQAIEDAIKTHTNISIEHVQNIIESAPNEDHVQKMKIIQDIEIITYNGFDLVFICDSMEHCLWCCNLENKTFIKLINSPSPNGVTSQNDNLYITSLQCGIYYIALKHIDFAEAFASLSFFSPYTTKTLQIFEDIVLTEITSMRIPPSDLRAPESPEISHMSKSSSSLDDNMTAAVPTNTAVASILFVIDDEYQMYMIRLSDLVLISFGVIEHAQKLFYYPNFDHLYITKPADNRIECICNVYHEIVSVRSCASDVFAPNTPTNSVPDDYDKLPPLQLNKPLVQILKTTKKTQQKENKQKAKRKQLSDEDIRTLHKNNGVSNTHTKKLCFPKSLYLVYEKSLNINENEDENETKNMDNVEMEILVEIDNMLQSYMLSELRQHSKKMLSYTKRNYSFLYLYTSPFDGESAYRELDANYESSVPVKNLIQHASIGPVVLVKLKPPTREQRRKQKERDSKLKKRKKKKRKQQTY